MLGLNRLLQLRYGPPLSFQPWGILKRYLDTIFLFAIQEDYVNAKRAKSDLNCKIFGPILARFESAAKLTGFLVHLILSLFEV